MTPISLKPIHTLHRWRCKNKDGSIAWEIVIKNAVTDEGWQHLLDTFFSGSSYTASLFIGIINLEDYITIADGDTAAKITTITPVAGKNQWKEFTTYSESVRQTLTFAAAVSKDILSNVASFSVTADFTFKGGFIITNSTKGGTTGILFCTAVETFAQSVTNGQTLEVDIALEGQN